MRDEANPYSGPMAAPAVAVPVDGAQLYTVSGIVVATFMGTPMASGWLMARNYRALGDSARATQAVLYGVTATVIGLTLAYLLPDNVPALAFSVPQLLAVGYIAQRLQGDRIEQYRSEGRVHSNWRAFGLGLLFSVGLLLVVIPLVYVLAMLGVIE